MHDNDGMSVCTAIVVGMSTLFEGDAPLSATADEPLTRRLARPILADTGTAPN